MDGMFQVSLVGTGVKTLGMLFVVLGLLVLFLSLVKRFLMRRGAAKGDIFIRVLSSLHLSPKERIELVEVSGERIVLGITPGHIRFLTKIEDVKGEKSPEDAHGKESLVQGP